MRVTVHNDLPFARPSETIELTAASLAPLGADLTKVHVFEQGSTREVLAQALDLDADGTSRASSFRPTSRRAATRSFELSAGRAADVSQGRLPRVRPLRPRALRRFRVGERPRRASHVRRGAGDVAEGAADVEHRRRLAQAHAPPGDQRLVHGRRLSSRHRRRRGLLFGRQEPRLRRQWPLARRKAGRLEELPPVARPGERPDPARLRAGLSGVE